MVKRIGSMAWRVEVGADGQLFSFGVRTDTGREYEVLFGTVDSTPILTDLLNEMARVHRMLPPRVFSEGAGPHHPRSVPLQPLATRVEELGGKPVLALDFGGTVLKVEIDPTALQQDLAKVQSV